jgi:monothiol glutaredoxin
MDPKDRVKQIVSASDVVLFMKGNKMFPQCGFSARAVGILQHAGCTKFETVDVLADPEIRQGVKDYSNWPTIPQLYIKGEFIGGSDIMMELYENGELQKKLSGG